MGIIKRGSIILAILLGVFTGVEVEALDWAKMPGVDTKKLTAKQKTKVEQLLGTLKNTRGCEGTLAHCFARGDMTARRHAGFVARMVRKGKKPDFIKQGIADRKTSAFPDETSRINLAKHPSLGKPQAKVVIVEYACFECPFCAHLAPKIKKLIKQYGDRLVYYYKFFPVRSHPRGVAAALAGFAAHKQGKFWPMYDLLFKNRADLEDEDLRKYARKLGLDMKRFSADLKSREAMGFVEKDKLEGMRFGVEGTPTFFVNGKEFRGVQDFVEIRDRVEEELDIVSGVIK